MVSRFESGSRHSYFLDIFRENAQLYPGGHT
jgi:hypothetical protein